MQGLYFAVEMLGKGSTFEALPTTVGQGVFNRASRTTPQFWLNTPDGTSSKEVTRLSISVTPEKATSYAPREPKGK